ARAAGAQGTDMEIAAALDSARVTVDRYCRDHFKPDPLGFVVPVDEWGQGYLPVIAYSVDTGDLAPDGRTWIADGWPPFPAGIDFYVSGDFGWRTTPPAFTRRRPMPRATPPAYHLLPPHKISPTRVHPSNARAPRPISARPGIRWWMPG